MKPTTIWVTVSEGCTLTFPSGVPNLAGRRLRAGEPPVVIDLSTMDPQRVAVLRAFLRKREIAGDCKVHLKNPSAPAPKNMAAPRTPTLAKE